MNKTQELVLFSVYLSSQRFQEQSRFTCLYKMTNKQLVGTGLFATNTEIKLTIPVQQSYLPVQNLKQPTQDLPKEMVYHNDARNLHFQLNFTCSDGHTTSEQRVEMGKNQMAKFSAQIEKIQDELNSYL